LGVTLFTPGHVSSPYFDHNPGAEARIPRISRLFRTLTPEEAAEALVRGLERGAAEVIVPPLLRLTVAFQRLFPGIVRSLLVRTGARHPPVAPRPHRP
jgi:short-subunit dehydrogenase